MPQVNYIDWVHVIEVCDEYHIEHILGWFQIYYQLQEFLIMTSLVFLGYSANGMIAFPWVITNVVKANLVTPCSLRALQHNVGTDNDVKNLSERNCNTLRDCDNPIYADLIGLDHSVWLKAILRSQDT